MKLAVRLFRSSVFILLFSATIIAGGCEKSPPSGPSRPVFLDIWRYYPIAEGNSWTYVTGNEDELNFNVYNTVFTDHGIRGYIEVESEGITRTQSSRWNLDRLYISSTGSQSDESLDLVGPLVMGQSWRKDDLSDNQGTFYIDAEITSVNHPIVTDAGTFSTTAVREISHREFPPNPLQVDTGYTYYAKDVGIVRWDLQGLRFDLVDYTVSLPDTSSGN